MNRNLSDLWIVKLCNEYYKGNKLKRARKIGKLEYAYEVIDEYDHVIGYEKKYPDKILDALSWVDKDCIENLRKLIIDEAISLGVPKVFSFQWTLDNARIQHIELKSIIDESFEIYNKKEYRWVCDILGLVYYNTDEV